MVALLVLYTVLSHQFNAIHLSIHHLLLLIFQPGLWSLLLLYYFQYLNTTSERPIIILCKENKRRKSSRGFPKKKPLKSSLARQKSCFIIVFTLAPLRVFYGNSSSITPRDPKIRIIAQVSRHRLFSLSLMVNRRIINIWIRRSSGTVK